jgi:hypothetical protein
MANGRMGDLRREALAGGEPLWIGSKDPVIFFPMRGSPKMVLNRRLPGITARDVLPSVPFGDYSSA